MFDEDFRKQMSAISRQLEQQNISIISTLKDIRGEMGLVRTTLEEIRDVIKRTEPGVMW